MTTLKPVAIIGVALMTMSASALHAQQPQPPQGWNELEGNATVEGAQPGMLQIRMFQDRVWQLQVIPGKTKVSYQGTAQVDFLQSGAHIRFAGEVNDTGALKDEIATADVFVPQGKAAVGMFSAGAGDDAKPLNKFAPGNYDFRVKLLSLKDREITFLAGGRKITGKLAADAKINLNIPDIGFSRNGDSVKLKVWFDPSIGALPNRVGRGTAVELDITGVKPLEGQKTAPGKKNRASASKKA